MSGHPDASPAGCAPELKQFRATVREFVSRAVLPGMSEWNTAGRVDRRVFAEAGAAGVLGFGVPADHGGLGIADFRFNAVVGEEFGRALALAAGIGITLHNDIVLPYLLELATPGQKSRWLPGTATGETILAIAMTEPGTGSDLSGITTSAVRSGDRYIVNGTKTFISNGHNADLVVTAVRTSPDPHRGLSLLVLERGMEGFERGALLRKIGMHSQDTSELFFRDVEVPASNLLGAAGEGFGALVRNLAQERLSIAIGALATAEAMFALTLDYSRQRTAFGNPIGSFQHNRFVLADIATELDVARTFLDDCVASHLHGDLSAVRAARAKLWITELQSAVADRCLQLHGGYGYMAEYPISTAFVDARVQRIYGGTSEIMREIIGRDLGL